MGAHKYAADPTITILIIALSICLCWIPIFAILSLCKCTRRRLHAYREKKGWIQPDPEMQKHTAQPMMPQLRIPERVAAHARAKASPESSVGSASGSRSGSGSGSVSAASDCVAPRIGEIKALSFLTPLPKQSRSSGGIAKHGRISPPGRKGVWERPWAMAVLEEPTSSPKSSHSSEDQPKKTMGGKGKAPERLSEPLPTWHYPTSKDWHSLRSSIQGKRESL